MSGFDWKSFLWKFDGRISCGDFWLRFTLPFFAGYLVFYAVGALLDPIFMLLPLLYVLAAIGPALAVGVKRWHDRGKSGWWMLTLLVPVLGWLYAFVECGCRRGIPETNPYGPDPLSSE